MKKIYLKFLLLMFIFWLILSCKNPPIFSAIEQEVKLKDFSIEGSIAGIAELEGNIYAANTKTVYSKKKGSNGNWNDIGFPGKFIQNLVSNGNSLFVASSEGGVYHYKNDWKSVTNGKDIITISGNSVIFGYDGKNVYKITEAGISSSVLAKDKAVFIGAGGNYFAFDDGIYNGSGKVNGSPSKIRSVCGGKGADIFILAEKKLYHYDGTGFTNIPLTIENPLFISYFKHGTKEKILIGSLKGYGEIELAENASNLAGAKYIPAGEAGSTTVPDIKAQYQSAIGAYSINPIFGIETENNNYIILAGIHAGSIYRHTGLWGLYSAAGKNEWNRE